MSRLHGRASTKLARMNLRNIAQSLIHCAA